MPNFYNIRMHRVENIAVSNIVSPFFNEEFTTFIVITSASILLPAMAQINFDYTRSQLNNIKSGVLPLHKSNFFRCTSI